MIIFNTVCVSTEFQDYTQSSFKNFKTGNLSELRWRLFSAKYTQNPAQIYQKIYQNTLKRKIRLNCRRFCSVILLKSLAA